MVTPPHVKPVLVLVTITMGFIYFLYYAMFVSGEIPYYIIVTLFTIVSISRAINVLVTPKMYHDVYTRLLERGGAFLCKAHFAMGAGSVFITSIMAITFIGSTYGILYFVVGAFWLHVQGKSVRNVLGGHDANS